MGCKIISWAEVHCSFEKGNVESERVTRIASHMNIYLGLVAYLSAESFFWRRKTHLTFPRSLEYIRGMAFRGSGIEKIVIPPKVKVFEEDTFAQSALEYRPIDCIQRKIVVRPCPTTITDWLKPSSAERAGFEPAKRFWRLHTFQACLFNHSSTSPFHKISLRVVP